ncbi:unnamed protein product, partial [Rotaria magnacalcarata]
RRQQRRAHQQVLHQRQRLPPAPLPRQLQPLQPVVLQQLQRQHEPLLLLQPVLLLAQPPHQLVLKQQVPHPLRRQQRQAHQQVLHQRQHLPPAPLPRQLQPVQPVVLQQLQRQHEPLLLLQQ